MPKVYNFSFEKKKQHVALLVMANLIFMQIKIMQIKNNPAIFERYSPTYN